MALGITCVFTKGRMEFRTCRGLPTLRCKQVRGDGDGVVMVMVVVMVMLKLKKSGCNRTANAVHNSPSFNRDQLARQACSSRWSPAIMSPAPSASA